MLSKFTLTTFFFATAGVQGILLFILLFTHPAGNRYSNRTLSLLILVFSLVLGYSVLFWTGLDRHFYYLLFWNHPLPFLIGPLFFLYIKSIYSRSFSWKDFFHLTPFLIFFLLTIPLALKNAGYMTSLFQYMAKKGLVERLLLVSDVFQNISLTGYCVAAGWIVWKRNSEGQRKQKWIRLIYSLFIGATLSFLCYFFLVWTKNITPEYDYMISASMSLFIYGIGYLGFRQHEFFSDKEKYGSSTLTAEKALQYKNQIERLMTDDKLYRNPQLKLSDLAKAVDASPYHLSQVINQLTFKSFSDYVNSFRVEEAKSLLQSPLNNMKILAIALEVGFNSKTAFNNAFRKQTKLSPSEFRDRSKSEPPKL